MNVGLIGVGTMGRPIAGHLIAGGHTLFLHDLAPLPQAMLEQGASACATPRQVAEAADVIITMVPDTPQVEAALFGPDGVAEGLSPGKLVIDMSSSAPLATKEFARRIAQRGCDNLDAPVSGGEAGAKAAELTIMVGGSEAAFERARPLLELLGQNVTLAGANGAGQTAKVAHQIIVAMTIQAVGEALVFASKAGADPGRVRQALMGGLAGSKVLETHGLRMIERDFDPGFKVELHQKDLGLALVAARMLGLYLPGTAAAQHLFNACVAMGGQAWDHSALVRALEKLAAHEIGERDASAALD
jgi:2-hydroxy-3-oxopropionate reductase